jgi:hypothetical protein
LKLSIWLVLILSGLSELIGGQANEHTKLAPNVVTAGEPSADSYLVLEATEHQESLLRAQIRLMHPQVLPLLR